MSGHRRKKNSVLLEPPSVTRQIARTLERYPDGGQILKELIQNADDAEATEVKFILDCNHYGTDHLIDDKLSNFQGPALYAWNNAIFQEEDWKHFGKMENSSKETDALKVGRFGVGFLSVFHITDLPIVISTDMVAILDPHEKYTGTHKRGWSDDLETFLHYRDHAACFASLVGSCSIPSNCSSYPHTIFRFPLRLPGADSEITRNPYPVERVREFLYESFLNEAPIILLFLKYVEEISLYDGDKLLYKVSIDRSCKSVVRSERKALIKMAKSSLNSSLRLYSMTSCVANMSQDNPVLTQYHWLILNMIGSTNRRINELSEKLQILPWVGIAVPLPNVLSLSNICVLNLDINQVSRALIEIEPLIRAKSISLPWHSVVQGHREGRAFCFLPLPIQTHLPVNIHGYFAVSDNRRTIEWPASDNKSDKALWNRELLLEQVAPLYSILIGCRSQLIKYRDTQLPIYGKLEGMTDPYAAWPLCSDVKHKEIWNELVKPTVVQCISNKVFWSPIGKWVHLNEAIFLPSKQTVSRCPFPKKAIDVLIQGKFPVVSLPAEIWATLQECLEGTQMCTVINQYHVRQAARNIQPRFVDYQELEPFLECIMYDITENNVSELFDLPIIPLASNKFQVRTVKSYKHVAEKDCIFFPSDKKKSDVVRILPGAEQSIVNPAVMHSNILYEKFLDLSKWRICQLQLLTPEIVCQRLLPISIQCWNGSYKPGKAVVWKKNNSKCPPIHWINDIWVWICRNVSTLEHITGIPILPKESVIDGIAKCTLLPFPAKSAKYYFKDSDATTLPSLLTKLDATVVERNDFVSPHRHSGIPNHIVDCSIPNVISFLRSNRKSLQLLSIADVNELRASIAQYYYRRQIPSEFAKFLRSMPIYELGIGGNTCSLTSLEQTDLILPPLHMSFNDKLLYPQNILNNADSVVYAFLNKKLDFQAHKADDVYLKILEFAVKECQRSNSWNNGDELIAWVIKETGRMPLKLVSFLQEQSFVLVHGYSRCRKAPRELYNVDDEQFCRLFDREKENVFPVNEYKENEVLGALLKMGLKSWYVIERNVEAFEELMYERAESVKQLPKRLMFERSSYILELICSYPRLCNRLLSKIKTIEFLSVQESPMPDFPSSMPWYGRNYQHKLEAPVRLCSHSNVKLIGSILPIIDVRYTENLNFHLLVNANVLLNPTVDNVVQQLNVLSQKFLGSQSESEAISHMVHKIYGFLSSNLSSLVPSRLCSKWIWWRDSTGEDVFMSQNSFVLSTSFDLTPFIFSIADNPSYFNYQKLFEECAIKRSTEPSDLVNVLHRIAKEVPSPLTERYIAMAISILNSLYDKKYTSYGNILIPTTTNCLTSVKQCTYDDREWVRKKVETRLKKYAFVHSRVTPEIAKYFDVQPLSQKVAPSSGLKLNYKQVGQSESLTRRISGIVNDYSGNIDVFKELIQNADDAKATQLKLLIDWRSHGTESLFEKEMRFWQGPALVAYNSAVFSDQDFKNICELAGETKMSDPLKTGRFGVGFCSCYSLTDVPSFLSRRYLTIFDPHTRYLGERVSSNNPGMRIDVVEEAEGVCIYEDQFAPYDGLFGCDLHNLDPEDGFNGTIFRFPLRMRQAPYSEITNDKYTYDTMMKRLEQLQSEAGKLLIFLKHLKSIEVFEWKEDSHQMKLYFKVSKEVDSTRDRIKFLQTYQSSVINTCSITVTVPSKKPSSLNQKYLISSAISGTSTEKKGLIPLTEIAVKITDEYMPVLETSGQLFCFLPLPLRHSLPFYINGYFDIGKDRQGLKEAVDSKEYRWNTMLIEHALPVAFRLLIKNITKYLQHASNKLMFLKNYYELWPNESTAKGWIAEKFATMMKSVLTKSDEDLLWTEANGGKWVKLQNAYLFKKTKDIPSNVLKNAIETLVSNGTPVIECPKHVFKLIVNIIEERKHLLNYQQFFTDTFLLKIAALDEQTQDLHLSFVLENINKEKMYPSMTYQWAVDLLKKSKCIPVSVPGVFAYPCDLIDVRCVPISELYSAQDHCFPRETFQRNACTEALIVLGMTHRELPIQKLVDRASIVSELDDEAALTHISKILAYISYIEHTEAGHSHHSFSTRQNSNRQERINALKDVKFLKAQPQSDELSLPWYEIKDSYYSPSELFSSNETELVFSQKPIFLCTSAGLENGDRETTDYNLQRWLGIQSRQSITLLDVIKNMLCLVNYLKEQLDKSTLNNTMTEFLNNCFPRMYKFISNQCIPDQKEKVREWLGSEPCVWQDDKLYYPSQLLWFWNKTPYYPYICPLSEKNKEFEDLFVDVLGVERDGSPEYFLAVLSKIQQRYKEEPVPDDMIEFLNDIALKLRVRFDSHKAKCYLPDKNRVLRLSSNLCCDSNLEVEWMQKLDAYAEFIQKGGHFIHPIISREVALKLGAYPIIDAVLRGIEDEDFLSGFGQHEDLVDRLNGILKKYPADDSIFREFIQNADDAKASEIVFIMDHRQNHPDELLVSGHRNWKQLQNTPALCIFNNRPFDEDDIQNICKLGRGGKGETADTIGRFGIGFNVAYHMSDCPMFVSCDEDCRPQDLCVFDPLMKYCPKINSRRPGRRWRSTGSGSTPLGQFSDQFKPFLFEIFGKFREITPCFEDLSKGFTMFRLPLIHYKPSATSYHEYSRMRAAEDSQKTRYFKEARVHHGFEVMEHIESLKLYSENMVLFLNHIKSISVFEIDEKGSIAHIFSSKKEMSYKEPNICEVTMNHQISTYEGEIDSSHSKWLMSKQTGIATNQVANIEDITETASERGLNLSGASAVTIAFDHRSPDGLLFYFLPTGIESCLNVHFNAHFLIDDSRTHLSKLHKLENWNQLLAEHVLVPSYVELLIKARDYVDRSQDSIDWYYSLFPDLQSISKQSEASALQINTTFYKTLIATNPPILLDQRNGDSINWLNINSGQIGYFNTTVWNDSQHVKAMGIGLIMASIEMPITCAPSFVFVSLCKVSSSYASAGTGLLTPEKVLSHLKETEFNNTDLGIIKDNCEIILNFCLQKYNEHLNLNLVPILVRAPILLTLDNKLVRSGFLYDSNYSSLLPHCPELFINTSLEASRVGKILRSGKAIVSLPPAVVKDKLQLSDSAEPVDLETEKRKLVKILWRYLRNEFIVTSIAIVGASCVVSQYFMHKPIIPSSHGTFYPPLLSKCVFIDSAVDPAIGTAIKKLGYPMADFMTVGSTVIPAVVKSLLSDTSNPNDLIKCMELCTPTSLESVEFTADEANRLISLFSLCTEIPSNICKMLKCLPLFQTIDGSYHRLSEAKRFYVMPLGVAQDGLMIIQQQTRHLILRVSPVMEKFYSKLIAEKEYSLAKMSREDFYIELILPNIEFLNESQLNIHLEVIKTWLVSLLSSSYIPKEKKEKMTEILTQQRFIIKEGKKYLASELYDPDVTFHATFNKNKLAPKQWTGEWLLFLRLLGLRRNVENTVWLSKANKVAQEGKLNNTPSQDLIEKSDALLKTLREKIAAHRLHALKLVNASDQELIAFLKSASVIHFIYHNEPSNLERYIVSITGKSPVSHKSFVQLHDTYMKTNENLAVLCRTILPSSCNFMDLFEEYCGYLSIRQINLKTVVTNLTIMANCLCSSAAMQAFVPSDIKFKAIWELKKIFEEHYKFLNDNCEQQKALVDLMSEKCIFLSSGAYYFNLVQPNHLVINLTAGLDLRPFCYKVPPELLKFDKLLRALNVREEIDPILCLDIISSINQEMIIARKKLASDEHYLNVCKNAYDKLISTIRKQPQFVLPKEIKMILPTEDFELEESKKLVCNDVPWLQKRLQKVKRLSYKFLYPPKPDSKGQKVPPTCLKIKLLSDMASEEVDKDALNVVNRCNQERLYEQNPNNAKRCELVETMLETFKSINFKIGFTRLYWDNNKKNPLADKNFCVKLKKVANMEVRCVKRIRTVVKFNGEIISGTEETNYSCFLKDDNVLCLYFIHMPDSLEDFLEQLAAALNKYLGHCIANETPIKAMLRCYPDEIERVLDQLQILPYDPKNFKNTKTDQFTVGTEISQDDLWFDKEDMLLFCNFEDGEKVLFHSLSSTQQEMFTVAQIVHCPTEPRNFFKLSDKYVKLYTESDKNGPKVQTVPLLQVYKVLNTSQRHVLQTQQSTMFSDPLIIAPISKTLNDLLTLITQLFNYNAEHHCCSILCLSKRIIAHMHYILVKTADGLQIVFIRAAKHLLQHIRTLNASEATCRAIITFVQKLEDLDLNDDDVFGIRLEPADAPTRRFYPTLGGGYASTGTGSTQRPSRFGFMGGSYSSRFRSSVPQEIPSIQPDPLKAKVWLQQAKADFFAARDIYECLKLGNGECKYPALVCFLSHDVIEKALKGVIYAKHGLKESLIECRDLAIITNELKESPNSILHTSASLVMVHGKRSRYPNYYYPPRTPANVLCYPQAVEAMRSANRVMQELQSDQNINQLLGDLETIMEDDFRTVLSNCLQSQTDYPPNWSFQEGDFKLVLLEEESDEYKEIAGHFQVTSPSRYYKVESIERVQNRLLWRRYFDCAQRMNEFNSGLLSEMSLFHGSGSNKPEDIYRGDAGFDMRFSNEGLWGKGNYFAVNSSYSHSYAHDCAGYKQMLMAHVLIGYDVSCPMNRSLTKPPYRDSSSGTEDGTAARDLMRRYDSVCGETGGSKVYITYENDRAYPAYLITYRQK